MFRRIDSRFGPIESDLMASSANAQCDCWGKRLPFCSRYFDKGCLAVDVLSVDVRCLPDLWDGTGKTLNYCFPPEPMIAQLVNHLRACKAKCVVIIPRVYMPWFSTLSEGLIHQERIARKGQAGVFIRFHKNCLAPYRPKHDMMAALVDFE